MSLFISPKKILFLLSLAISSCLLAEQGTWEVVRREDGKGYAVGSYNVLNSSMPNAKLKDAKWRHFMHGITDQEATPIPWNPLLSSGQEKYLDFKGIIDIPDKSSELPSIKLSGGETIEVSRPILDSKKVKALSGKCLRFFIWMKGESTGKGNSLWDNAPHVRFTLYDGDGDVRQQYVPLFHTRGTFPWHCYYMDVELPPIYQAAALKKNVSPNAPRHSSGLFITLANPASGIAYFSTLSCQPIPKDKTLATTRNKNRLADPLTGSLAPNPDYDELPMHFMLGLPDKQAWSFLKGTKTLPDITRLAEMEKYQAEYYRDWFHTIFVYTKLPYIDYYLKLTKSPIQFEKGCMELLLERAIDAQMISDTCLWCVDDVPNLYLSSAVASQIFSPVQPKRADRPQAVQTPWYSINNQGLRQADAIIESLLKAQRKTGNPLRLAGWNHFAFQKSTSGDPRFTSPFDFSATVAATTLLHYAIPKAKPENALRAQAAVRQCWEYAMEYMLNQDGTWKNTYNQAYSTPSYDFFQFMEKTPYLEFRCNPKLAPVRVSATYQNGKATFTWAPSASAVALRIFVVPASLQPTQLNETHLVVIVQPPNQPLSRMDPLLVLRDVSLGAFKKWGISARDADTPYVVEKILGSQHITAIPHQGAISVPYVTTLEKPMVIYLAEVTSYGEMSPFTKLQQEIKTEGKEESTAPGGSKVSGNPPKPDATQASTPAPAATKTNSPATPLPGTAPSNTAQP